MKLPIFAAALFAVAASASSASAMPVVKHGATEKAPYTSTLVQTVRHDGNVHRKGHRHHNDWRKDKRYSKYGKWNRYSKRPNRWRERHCVAVGPFWFCP